MKSAGIFILFRGLFKTVYAGVRYIVKEPLVASGPFHTTRNEEHHINWQPCIGAGLMVIGGGALFFGKKGAFAA